MMTLSQLQARGFDLSKYSHFTQAMRVRCSQCEAMVVNGVPIHESGCPNETHECRGCNAIIPAHQDYCGECSR